MRTATWIAFGLMGLLLSINAFGDKPSATGWRGDWSGHYPEATPPTKWGRWNTSLHDLRCQANRPGGRADSAAVDLPLGFLSEWMIMGPVAGDPAKGLDTALIADEAQLQPRGADRNQNAEWKAVTTVLPGIDFKNQFGKDATGFAYACTYVQSPRETKVTLAVANPEGVRAWADGQPITFDKIGRAPLALKAGWTCLLFKTGDVDKKGWNLTARLAPAAPLEYGAKNIAWMTRMPEPSVAQPVLIGDRLFVCSEPCDLVCVNKADGKLLWIRSHNIYETVTDEQKKANPAIEQQVGPMASQLKDINAQIIAKVNAAIDAAPHGPPTLDAAQASIPAKLIEQKKKLDNSIDGGLNKADGTFAIPARGQYEWASPTPCSDGENVYVFYSHGVVASYDRDGNRRWIALAKGYRSAEHGWHPSPAISAGKFIVYERSQVTAYDCKTGAVAWELPGLIGRPASACVVPARIGDVDVVFFGWRCVRTDTGKVLFDLEGPLHVSQQYGWTEPVIQNGRFYDYCSRGDGGGGFLYIVKLPDTVDGQPTVLQKIEAGTKGDLRTGWFVASCLVDNGLAYLVNEEGKLFVFDTEAGSVVYTQQLPMRTPIQYVVSPGACASPTLAGKYIYTMDNQNTTVIFEPGRAYKQIAANLVEQTMNPHNGQGGGWGDLFGQEQTLSTPIFEGKRMYYRGQEYLYCIGEE